MVQSKILLLLMLMASQSIAVINKKSENGAIYDDTFKEGSRVPCDTHTVCYDYSAPNAWTCERAGQGTMWAWTESGGCHCDRNIKSCVHERVKFGRRFWQFCIPTSDQGCSGVHKDEAKLKTEQGGIRDNTVHEGLLVGCTHHSDCYGYSAPNAWVCQKGHGTEWKWTEDKSGCHCDKHIGSCVHERLKKRETDWQRFWAYCIPKKDKGCHRDRK